MRSPHPTVCGPHTPLSPSTKLVTQRGSVDTLVWSTRKPGHLSRFTIHHGGRETGEFKWFEFYFLNVPCGPLMAWTLHSSQVLSVLDWMNQDRSHSWLMEQFILSTDQDFDKGTSYQMHYYKVRCKCEEMPADFVSTYPYPCNNWCVRKTCSDSFSIYFWNWATLRCKLLYIWT